MRTLIVAAALAATVNPAAHAAAAPAGEADGEWQWLGLMRVRDMTPFGLARLDFLPAHAVAAAPGTFAIELNLSYQNTWARSGNVAEWLKERGLRRAALSPADVDEILALPGDAYLVDGEYGLVDMTLHYRFSPHVGVYATLPYFFFNRGFLDDPIEGFHGRFGFGNAGREFLPYNQWQAIVKVQNTSMVLQDPPPDAIGDPVFGIRYSLKAQPRKWNLVVETAVKLPRQNERTFISTGSTDFGLQLSLQRFFSRNALYLTMSGVYYASPDPNLADDQWIPTFVAGWERRLTQRLGMVLQLYDSRSAIQNTNLRELSATKLQMTAGIQWLSKGNLLRFGLTENLRNFNNTPDVGATLSLGRIFHAGTRSH